MVQELRIGTEVEIHSTIVPSIKGIGTIAEVKIVENGFVYRLENIKNGNDIQYLTEESGEVFVNDFEVKIRNDTIPPSDKK